MKQANTNQSVFEKLDHKHRPKSELVFLKLIAKQKSKRRDWSDVRAETLPSDKSDIRNGPYL
jgi:hypothetical protein